MRTKVKSREKAGGGGEKLSFAVPLGAGEHWVSTEGEAEDEQLLGLGQAQQSVKGRSSTSAIIQ